MPHGLPLFSRFLNRPLSSAGELGGDHHLVAAHVDEVVDVLDVDGALVDAGAAGGARPQGVGVDDRALVASGGRRRRSRRSRGAGRSRARRPAGGPPRPGPSRAAWRGSPRRPRRARGSSPCFFCTASDVGRLRERVVAQVHDHELRAQRLVGVPRRALALAAAALGAGRDVEQALPGEVLDPAAAERRRPRPGPRSRSSRCRSTSPAAGRGRRGAGRSADVDRGQRRCAGACCAARSAGSPG